MDDLRARLANRVQLTSDGHKAYLEAVEGAFGGDVDYAMLVKMYGSAGSDAHPETRYSPSECTGSRKQVIEGFPRWNDISTSYVERQNLTMGMSMRRFVRLTNTFSKRVENHAHALAFHFMHKASRRTGRTARSTSVALVLFASRLYEASFMPDFVCSDLLSMLTEGTSVGLVDVDNIGSSVRVPVHLEYTISLFNSSRSANQLDREDA